MDVFGAFQSSATGLRASVFLPLLMLIFSLLLADFFDTMGTVVAIGAGGGLLDEQGTPPNPRIDPAWSTRSPPRPAARLASPTPSLHRGPPPVWRRAPVPAWPTWSPAPCFLLAMFLAPLSTVVPFEAAAPALVVVGFLMMTAVTKIDWADYEIGIPAFLTITLMPFTLLDLQRYRRRLHRLCGAEDGQGKA